MDIKIKNGEYIDDGLI